MKKILGVGIATLDIINRVADYPVENSEIRILSQDIRRGGNATNTLTILSQLGQQCDWAGVYVQESDGLRILQELERWHINYSACRVLSQGKMPVSYVTLNTRNGSRSIQHYRDLPEFDFASFQKIDLSQFDWLHFEGRNVLETLKMLQFARQQFPQIPLSLEIEKPRDNIEQLFPLPDVLFFSKQFALAQGAQQATEFLQQQREQSPQAILSCAWGSQGAWGLQPDSETPYHAHAHPPERLVDTLGAGDTFNAAMIDALLRQQSLPAALEFACATAGKKCGLDGCRIYKKD
ncbi:PfkB family carbohydrate kinase [Candidatus Venteria ishoeyi]|uniref:Fructosamine kinase FrlD n=1 Tax=Candidatus Venteria ishoeyi TaxID=1899563 RepID=A0A1H6FHR8_9GAMM|nr:PfkB family carbohydrate kinase [Candidatus Venteria ishoeyi]MDM8547882.1 PfkB family carbohydrate kinase [Candidatus Venteria ishoeyi]SEH08971.1 Fructosamine kinase FrlD [Candidatus Venteria ishoeyi]